MVWSAIHHPCLWRGNGRRVGRLLAVISARRPCPACASACCCYQRSLLWRLAGVLRGCALGVAVATPRAHPRVLASLALRADPDGGGVGPAGGGDDAEDQDRVAAPGHDPPAGVRGGQE